MVITKSISRFARNTVDSLTIVRKLKDKGVEVYFEKENIWTMDLKGELLITIMSSLSQEESRSISENVTWGQRKCFADTAELDKKCEKLLDEIDVTKELIARLIKENAAQAQNQEDYLKKYESLAQRVEKLKSRYEILSGKRERRLYQADNLSSFLFAIKELDV